MSKLTITQKLSLIIKNLVLLGPLSLTLILGGLNSSCLDRDKMVYLQIPSGKKLELKLADTLPLQEKGLSGVRPGDLAPHQGMIFFYKNDEFRVFWMPDTYFDLGLIYVDVNLKIVDITILPSHPGWDGPIPRGRPVFCRHVIELSASSPFFKELEIGQKFILL